MNLFSLYQLLMVLWGIFTFRFDNAVAEVFCARRRS